MLQIDARLRADMRGRAVLQQPWQYIIIKLLLLFRLNPFDFWRLLGSIKSLFPVSTVMLNDSLQSLLSQPSFHPDQLTFVEVWCLVDIVYGSRGLRLSLSLLKSRRNVHL